MFNPSLHWLLSVYLVKFKPNRLTTIDEKTVFWCNYLEWLGEGQFVWRLVIFVQSECIDLCTVQCHKATYFTYERLECVLILYQTWSTYSQYSQVTGNIYK